MAWTDDIISAFGDYHAANATQPEEIMLREVEFENYMTSVTDVSDEWRSTAIVVDQVLQPYQSGWTETGDTDATDPGVAPGMVANASSTGSTEKITFQPVIGKVHPIKVNISFESLDELQRNWLAFLTDERVTPDQWPITKYMLNAIMKKAGQELDDISARGSFVAPTAGEPGAYLESTNGILTKITSHISDGDIAAITVGSFNSTTILTKIETFLAGIPPHMLRNGILHMSYTNLNMLINAFMTKYGSNSVLFSVVGDRQNPYEVTLPFGATKLTVAGHPSFATSNRWLFIDKQYLKKLYDKKEGVQLNTEVILGKLYVHAKFKRGYAISVTQHAYVNDQS